MVLGTRLSDRISNSNLYIKFCSVPLYRAIGERLRWLEHVLWINDDILSKIVLVGKPSRVKRKSGRHQLGCEVVVTKYLREMVTSSEDVRKQAFNRVR